MNGVGRKLATVVGIMLTSVALMGGLGAWGSHRYGSCEAFVAALRGHILYVDPTDYSFGEVEGPTQRTATIRIRNLASYPVKLLGSRTDCGCVLVNGLPFELASGSVIDLTIQITASRGGSSSVDFTRVVTLYTDAAGVEPRVEFHLRVLPAEVGADSSRNPG